MEVGTTCQACQIYTQSHLNSWQISADLDRGGKVGLTRPDWVDWARRSIICFSARNQTMDLIKDGERRGKELFLLILSEIFILYSSSFLTDRLVWQSWLVWQHLKETVAGMRLQARKQRWRESSELYILNVISHPLSLSSIFSNLQSSIFYHLLSSIFCLLSSSSCCSNES